MLTSAQWKSLLTDWSSQLLGTDLTCHLEPADCELDYLGFSPASAFDIAALEGRVGVALPPSYRAFLEATNGFRVLSPFIYRLRHAADVDWFRVENQGWAEAYNEPTLYDDPDRPAPADDEYFDYTKANECGFRSRHLFSMLQVSDVGDGVMLLNPMAVTPDGEWEAWFFANWIPGAYRYASFAHMMVETCRSMRSLQCLPDTPQLPTVGIPGPSIPRHSIVEAQDTYKPKRRARKRRKGESQLDHIAQFLADLEGEETAPAPAELVKLLNELRDSDQRSRAKAIRVLQGKLKIRAMSTRHPDLVPLAAELARSLPESDSRCICVHLLINITPDGRIPEWLHAALNDPDTGVQSAALYAVFYFKGPELVAPITKILSDAPNLQLAQQAATALSEIPDARAIPALAAALDCVPRLEVPMSPQVTEQAFQQYYTTIVVALSRYGQAAVPPLVPFLSHPDPNLRMAAIIGLRAIGESTSRAAVEMLKSDPNPGVRQQAEMCDRVWGNLPGIVPHQLS